MNAPSDVKRPEASKQPRETFVYDPRNERVIISAAIVADKKARNATVRSISSDEFLVPAHSTLWRAKRRMVEQDLEYDSQVFRRLVVDEGMPADEADALITSLEAEAVMPDNFGWHVEMLKWDSTRARVLQGAFPELLRALKDPKATVDTVSACALAVTRAVQEGGGRKHMRRKDELAREYWADFEARCANQETFPYGYAEIDTHLVEGSMPGKCAVFAGLSGSGKSTFCAAMAIRLAKLGRRVAYGAFEMGSKSTMDVMISNITGIPIKAIVQGRMSPEDRARVRKAIIWITNNIRFMNNPSFDASIRGKKRDNDRSLDVFEGYLAEAGCDVIFCDLWERLLSDLSYDGMTQALYRQQDMFARYNIFGIIVQQLRGKDVEKRSDKRPTRESIKGTGAFVEVADQIFGIHREAQFKKVPDDSIELVCLKQRKGEANWAVAYDWDGATSYIGGTGREVSFDPGLDDVGDIGGIDDIQTNRSKKRSGGRVRREDNVA